MRTRLPVFAVIVMAIVACGPKDSSGGGGTVTPAGAPAGLSTADRAALQTALDSAAARVLTRRLDAWAAGFAEDAVFGPPNHPLIHGRAAIKAWADSFPTMNAFAFTNVTIDGAGDLAWGTSGIPMTFTPPGAPQVKDVGKQLVVWRRQADGSWTTAAVMFNSDLPAAPPPDAGKKR